MGDVIQAALQGKPQPGVVSEKRVPTAGSEAPRSPQRCCAALGCFRAVQTSPLCAPHPSMLCPTEPWVQQTRPLPPAAFSRCGNSSSLASKGSPWTKLGQTL